MYYPSSENKGADQLRSYCEADLRLCFRLCRLLVFPWGGSFLYQDIADPFFAYCKLHADKNATKAKRRHWLAIQSHVRQHAQTDIQDEKEKVCLIFLKVHKLDIYLFNRCTGPCAHSGLVQDNLILFLAFYLVVRLDFHRHCLLQSIIFTIIEVIVTSAL